MLPDTVRAELSRLRWIAGAVVAWLSLAVAAGGLATMALMFAPYDLDSTAYQVVLCVTSGAFGASLAALLSAVTRVAQGWERGDGQPHPANAGPMRFSARLVPLYVVRPLFGAATGLIVYFTVVGVVLLVLVSPEELAFDPVGLLFLALLGGLFSQTFLERLRGMFDALFGRNGLPLAEAPVPPAKPREELAAPAANAGPERPAV